METQTKEKGAKSTQNGAPKNGTPKKTADNGTAVKETAVKAVKTEPKPVDINERVQKIKEARGLAAKRDKTIETLNELREFKFSADDSSYLTINDGDHREFQTSNSNLIGMLVEHLETLLDGKAKELEKEILAFQI